jgi:prepilin-type N-terminal cleavage/methylation domain-containing protein
MKTQFASRGFTLVEVLIVIAIMGVLSSTAIPRYMDYIKQAHSTACLAERGVTDKMITLYCNENPDTPLTNLSQLTGTEYMGSQPQCPYGGEYVLIPADEDHDYPSVGCSLHYWPGKKIDDIASDNFDSGNADNWTEIGRDWKVTDGKYYGGTEHGSSGGNMTFLGDEDWTDYSVELDANLINGGDSGYGYGVYFRAQDYNSLNAYIFQYDPGWGSGAFLFRKIVDGNEQPPFAVVRVSEGYIWNGTEKHVRVEVSGDTFKAYVSDIDGGDTPVLEGSDSSYTNGSMGLRTWGSAQASFDNIKVSEN